ncbi:MAG: DUF2304 family protein [Candidatus Nanopelagicales bacterium]
MTANVLAAVAAVVVFAFILWLLRRGVLEKYAVLWLFVSVVAAVLADRPRRRALGGDRRRVEIPANLLFFVTIVLLVLVSVQLSYEPRSAGREDPPAGGGPP